MGTWDYEWIRGVIDAYHEANPIDEETYELLWIDMAFPNEFYKHVKEIVYEPEIFMNTELEAILQRIIETEANKWEVLSELARDKTKYLPGNYPGEESVLADTGHLIEENQSFIGPILETEFDFRKNGHRPPPFNFLQTIQTKCPIGSMA